MTVARHRTSPEPKCPLCKVPILKCTCDVPLAQPRDSDTDRPPRTRLAGVHDRVPAVSTCKARNWRAGTNLKSAAWTTDRRIVHVGVAEVRTTRPRTDGRPEYHRLTTFPADVREVGRG